jgi:malate/lactate dehydrogenase
VPSVINKKGVVQQLHVKLDKTEQKALKNSANVIKKVIKTIL